MRARVSPPPVPVPKVSTTRAPRTAPLRPPPHPTWTAWPPRSPRRPVPSYPKDGCHLTATSSTPGEPPSVPWNSSRPWRTHWASSWTSTRCSPTPGRAASPGAGWRPPVPPRPRPLLARRKRPHPRGVRPRRFRHRARLRPGRSPVRRCPVRRAPLGRPWVTPPLPVVPAVRVLPAFLGPFGPARRPGADPGRPLARRPSALDRLARAAAAPPDPAHRRHRLPRRPSAPRPAQTQRRPRVLSRPRHR